MSEELRLKILLARWGVRYVRDGQRVDYGEGAYFDWSFCPCCNRVSAKGEALPPHDTDCELGAALAPEPGEGADIVDVARQVRADLDARGESIDVDAALAEIAEGSTFPAEPGEGHSGAARRERGGEIIGCSVAGCGFPRHGDEHPHGQPLDNAHAGGAPWTELEALRLENSRLRWALRNVVGVWDEIAKHTRGRRLWVLAWGTWLRVIAEARALKVQDATEPPEAPHD